MSLRAAALLVALIVALDRATKALVMARMSLGESIAVIPGFFSLTSVRNRGAAFGMLADLPEPWRLLFFVTVAVAAVGLFGWMLLKVPERDRWQRLSLVCVLAGAAGNLYDRVRYGEVVDFLDCYVGDWHWPAFNVADSAITVGAVLLVLLSLRGEGKAE